MTGLSVNPQMEHGPFYVIGAEAYWDDVETGLSYTYCLVGPGPKVGPLAEHGVRSQVAGIAGRNTSNEREGVPSKSAFRQQTLIASSTVISMNYPTSVPSRC